MDPSIVLPTENQTIWVEWEFDSDTDGPTRKWCEASVATITEYKHRGHGAIAQGSIVYPISDGTPKPEVHYVRFFSNQTLRAKLAVVNGNVIRDIDTTACSWRPTPPPSTASIDGDFYESNETGVPSGKDEESLSEKVIDTTEDVAEMKILLVQMQEQVDLHTTQLARITEKTTKDMLKGGSTFSRYLLYMLLQKLYKTPSSGMGLLPKKESVLRLPKNR